MPLFNWHFLLPERWQNNLRVFLRILHQNGSRNRPKGSQTHHEISLRFLWQRQQSLSHQNTLLQYIVAHADAYHSQVRASTDALFLWHVCLHVIYMPTITFAPLLFSYRRFLFAFVSQPPCESIRLNNVNPLSAISIRRRSRIRLQQCRYRSW